MGQLKKDIEGSDFCRLNIGCNDDFRNGGVNVDRYTTNPEVVVMDVETEKLPRDDETFDISLCSHMLEHLSVEKKLAALKEIIRVTKINGKIEIYLPMFCPIVQHEATLNENYLWFILNGQKN